MHFQKTVLYVAGPMSGIPQYNFPLFEAAATALREDGWVIVSPHECDSEETRKAAWASPDGKFNPDVESESWGTCLARDVKMLADGLDADQGEVNGEIVDRPAIKIDGIALLPNWDKSKGARLEAFVGLLTGKEFYTAEHFPEAEDMGGKFVLTCQSAEWVQAKLAAPWAYAIMMHKPLPEYADTAL